MNHSEFKKLLFILRFPIVIFLVDKFLNIPFDLYKTFLWLDIPMHLVGGASIGVSAVLLWRYKYGNQRIVKTGRFFLFLWTLGIVSLVAIMWEFYEFTFDYFFRTVWQLGAADTMKDMFLGLVGGGVTGWCMIYGQDRVRK